MWTTPYISMLISIHKICNNGKHNITFKIVNIVNLSVNLLMDIVSRVTKTGKRPVKLSPQSGREKLAGPVSKLYVPYIVVINLTFIIQMHSY